MKQVVLYTMLFIALPFAAQADVVINEIGWMGNAESASNEWVELLNTGSSTVALDGWVLASADGVPTISLSGSIEPGGFFLIERTDDDSVPDVPADLIASFGGGLANTGETLVLTDASAVEQDRAEGGTGWTLLGGNNTTKHTAQRQADGSWITGVPTPRAENSTVDTGQESSGGSSGSSKPSPKSTTPVGVYQEKVFGHIFEGDRHATVGTKVFFRGFAFNESQREVRGADYTWSMGDGLTRYGQEHYYTYREPGTYLVILRIDTEREHIKKRVTITAVPADVHLVNVVDGEEGFIALQNNADEEVDVSGWQLSVSDSVFVFAEDTLILPKTTLLFSHALTGLETSPGESVLLLYPSGKVAGMYPGASTSTPAEGGLSMSLGEMLPPSVNEPSLMPRVLGSIVVRENTEMSGDATTEGDEEVLEESGTVSFSTEGETLVGESFSPSDSTAGVWAWLTALAIVLLLAGAGLVMAKRPAEAPPTDEVQRIADEIAIIE